MTESTSEPPWPDYLPLPRADIQAIGVIALNYCQLENMFRALFSAVTRLNKYQTQALFHRLANNVRKDVLSELLAKTTIPDDLREAVKHFIEGFGQCAENRHFIMHSSSGGLHRSQDKHGLVLERHSRAGNVLVCFLTLEDLKRTADDIHTYTSFGAWVTSDADGYATHIASNRQGDYRLSRATLLERPPPPVPLNWRSPDAPKAHGIPPAALHLISAYRVHDRDAPPPEKPSDDPPDPD